MDKFLIPKTCLFEINSADKINNIYCELRDDLLIDDSKKAVPNAVGVLFRVFLEVSLDHYAKMNSHNFKKGDKISQKIPWVVKNLEGKGHDPKKFTNINKVGSASRENSYLSIENFHEYVHSGTKEQTGKYKIDCRFNKKDLISRIKKIAKYKDRIYLYNLDAVNLLENFQKKPRESTEIFYFDPPYYFKASSLYDNHYKPADHEQINKLIRNIENIHWIVSYDDTYEIEKIYEWVNKDRQRKYCLRHSAYKPRQGKEILFFSKNLLIPDQILNRS